MQHLQYRDRPRMQEYEGMGEQGRTWKRNIVRGEGGPLTSPPLHGLMTAADQKTSEAEKREEKKLRENTDYDDQPTGLMLSRLAARHSHHSH